MTRIDLTTVANEARTWFEGYVETFTGPAAERSTDPAPLLDYFSVPTSTTTGTAHTVLTSTEALSRALRHRQELSALRDADNGGSTALDTVVRGLNERAVETEVARGAGTVRGGSSSVSACCNWSPGPMRGGGRPPP
ncbi:hypothetical protein ACIRVF_41945 [Kitasatospora sp. NPDC101157]|uniref:DUF6841 family protein n=1 Tax=Kitasatospora sp. NPDC101157 TaxID=3364098 RepID=UPI003812C96D